jgi:hypothetical protein
MKKFGVPGGPVDRETGPLTQRGLCAMRQIVGYTPTRNNLSMEMLDSLRYVNKNFSSLSQIKAPKLDGESTYLLVQKHCQVMFYVENGRYKRVIPVSTGVSKANSKDGKDHTTPNFKTHLGYTQRGWSCSTEYPESCRRHTEGRFDSISNYGNMYNKRLISGSYYLHGSTDVPTYPASMGCIRVTTADSDWMYDHVGNNEKPYFKVVGNY